MVNKKDYSLLLIQTVERLFNRTRKFVEENSDILELTKNNAFELLIEDKSKQSTFKFLIYRPSQSSTNKIHFNVELNPTNSVVLSPSKYTTEEKSVTTLLESWTKLIRQYNDINLTPEESILNEYEKEFYDNFELLDEDADTHPYGLEKQIILHNYFGHVIKLLQTNEIENSELIEEAKEIKENIPKMTKRTTVKKISRFFAMVRRKSLPLLKELLETGKKELFKKAITGGFDMIDGLISLL
ncbi:MAG: hypothetical protein ACK5M7_19060 [Draconibacterium sp.]